MEGAHGITTDALVYLGIFVSVGMIAVSALVNFRVGYRAADTSLDGWIYGTGFAFLDLLKAILPFVFVWGLKQRDWLAVGASAVAFVTFTLYSVTAGMGFAAEHRAFREGERTGALEQRSDLRSEISRLEALAVKLGAQRSENEVSNAIEAVFARPMGKGTVSSVSERCALARRDTREACAEIAGLMTELERARQWADVDRRLQLAREQMEELGGRGAHKESDPQVAVLLGLTKMTGAPFGSEQIRYGLALLVGLVLEIGSGFGLYLATTPWRREIARIADVSAPAPIMATDAEMPALTAPMLMEHSKHQSAEAMQMVVREATAIGSVMEFAVACVHDAEGSVVTVSEVYQAYETWCRTGAFAPLRQAEFQAAFVDLAREVGLIARLRGANISFVGARLEVVPTTSK